MQAHDNPSRLSHNPYMRSLPLLLVALTCLGFLAACGRNEETEAIQAIDLALQQATSYLTAAEHNGRWPSDTYGLYRDGVTLTPHVLSSLIVLAPRHDATQRGLDELRAWVHAEPGDSENAPPIDRLDLPVYTLAAASWCLGFTGDAETQTRYLEKLRDHHLTEHLGWSPDDACYGGFGDGPWASRKDGPRPPTANLSATLFAAGALRFAGGLDEPTRTALLAFVQRCHNPRDAGHSAADGGFFFTPTDPHRNKAGDLDGRPRSYQSPTADGVRLLLACGVPLDDPAVVEARDWLLERFDPSRVAGDFNADREPLRDSYHFYTMWSTAHALHRLQVPAEQWAQPLADELIKRQNPDGSWTNRYTDGHEDDPLVATPLAAGALAICREAITTKTP